GEEFAPSSDPLLEELQGHLKGIKLGDSVDAHAVLKPILSNANIFGLDLYTTPLAEKVEALFTKLIAGPGAVRATIHEEIN
ncbi:mannitol dehydrogenase family protein, partial [Aerococcus urinae]|nr:mannitol dehydrogenase family protein [Aerococcus urinae]